MNTQKEVFNKLFKEDKTELSADGISKILNEVKSLQNNIDNSEKKSKKLISNLKENISDISFLKNSYTSNKKEISSKLNVLNKNFNTIYKQAKDLGVDLKNIPAYKDYLSAKKILDDSFDKNQDFWANISKYI